MTRIERFHSPEGFTPADKNDMLELCYEIFVMYGEQYPMRSGTPAFMLAELQRKRTNEDMARGCRLAIDKLN